MGVPGTPPQVGTWKVLDVAHDNHCLFHCFQQEGLQMSIQDARNYCASQIEANPELAPFCDGDRSPQEIAQGIRGQAWGGNICISLLAGLAGLNVHTCSSGTIYSDHRPEDDVSARWVVFAHVLHGGTHWVRVLKYSDTGELLSVPHTLTACDQDSIRAAIEDYEFNEALCESLQIFEDELLAKECQ